MISLSHLWLPIFVSAIAVFVVSALLHMMLTYHNSDYKPLANEDEVRAAINKGGAKAGQYVIPYCVTMKAMQEPAMVQKLTEGPNGFIALRAPGVPKMGPSLIQWFILALVLSSLTGYVAGHAMADGTARPIVFHMASIVALLGYAGALAQGPIWRSEPWSVTIKAIVDGLIYALVTGAVFAWMWPGA